MYLYGASGHCKVVLEILEQRGVLVKGIYDDDASIQRLFNYEVLHTSKLVMTGADEIIICVGKNVIRKRIAEELSAIFGRAIHVSATVSPRCTLGAGTVVMAGVTINSHSSIGKHCILNTNCSIDHDCVIGDFVHISPHAALAGQTVVGTGTHVGIGASIIPAITIGQWATIGAGAVIIEDVPDHAVVVGNPGRIIKYGSR